MILITTILVFAVIANMVLGVTVFLTNRHRRVNQVFLFSSLFMFSWLGANLLILFSATGDVAIFNINLATAISSCLPTSFQFLRLAIKYPEDSFNSLVKRAKVQLFFNLVAISVCFIPGFIESVEFPDSIATIDLAKPNYGPLFMIFLGYMLGSIFVLSINVFNDRKRLKGTQLLELEFLIFACISGLIVGVFLGTIVGLVTRSSNSVPIANAASVLTVSGIVAYGISVHRILPVSSLLRKVFAYSLVITYLSFIYYITLQFMLFVSALLGFNSNIPSQLIATLCVTFSMLPARRRVLRATEKLFGSSSALNMQRAIKKAGDIFQSVTTSSSIMQHFSDILVKAFNAEKVTILIKSGSGFSEAFSTHDKKNILRYSDTNPVIEILTKTKEPASSENLSRVKQTELNKAVIKQFKQHEVTIASGIFMNSKLRGVVAIRPKNKGQVYDGTEQDALQILCNQFAVALENADLYTKMQDSKIQNEIMLDQLVSGVVVANPNGEITLCNHEAQRITGIDDKKTVGQHIAILPKEIYLALEVTLKNKNGVRNIDATLFPQEYSKESRKNIRMGSAFLFGHDGKPMGALLVFTDVTELKGLEEQVRRSDQLSSVGTLAAGMAHEIKNPLVTIKTFTQLLPKRYGDEDFRNDFSSLVAHEVNRIDGIVNELLSFSKPAKPHLLPMNIQETIDQSLKLIHEQLVQKNITLTNNCKAASTHIFGDAKLLSQALINLNLNAIEAIGETGSITFGTLNCSHRFANGDSPGKATTRKCIRLQISDSGKGIKRGDLQKIFDPFFTSKSEGTGMGLSVAHGIISEHHGVIEVESEPGRGTSFYLYIPLLEEGAVL